MTDRRTTIVTGASQGIGRELAVAFARTGDAVVLASRDREKLDETADLVSDAGGEPMVCTTDVTDDESVAGMASEVQDRLGRVDVVVNNSGIGGPSSLLWETDSEGWLATFDVNVHGVYRVCRELLPVMVRQGSGSVIVIGSISGKRPLVERSAYTSTKAALIGLVRTLAVETGPYGIRVNLISPGFVAGPRLDWVISAQGEARGLAAEEVREEFAEEAALKRLTEAGDVAAAAVFLASDGAAGITGADINVNSGVVMY